MKMIDYSNVIKSIPVVQLVAINRIYESPYQTHMNSRNKKDAIKASLIEVGLLNPLICRESPCEQGDYELISGKTRLECIKEEGMLDVPIILLEINDTQVMQAINDFNIHRERMLPMAMAHTIKQRSQAITQDSKNDLIKYLGLLFDLRDASIYNYLTLVRLPDYLHEFVDNHRITMKAAVQLVDVPEVVLASLGEILKLEPIKISKEEMHKINTALKELDADEVASKLLEILLNETDDFSLQLRGPIYKHFKSYFPLLETEDEIAEEIKKILDSNREVEVIDG